MSEKAIKQESTIKKKWYKPVGIMVVCVLLFIVGYVAIHQSSKRKIVRSIGLSENDVIATLKKKNYFDKDYNPDGKGIENKYVLQEINGDSVVFDEATNLIWQKSGSPNEMIYKDAKKYIDRLNNDHFAGSGKWRLPKLEEAMSLMEPEKKNYLYIDPIFDRKQMEIWTAEQTYGASWAWFVSFYYGGCNRNLLLFNNNYVRAVRSRQAFEE